MKDLFGRELKEGDNIIYCGRPGREHEGLIAGKIYEIKTFIINASSNIEYAVIVKDTNILSGHIIKIMGSDIEVQPDKIETIANNIIKLINSKPWSPRKEEIIAVLKGDK